MSVEAKIKELLGRVGGSEQLTEESADPNASGMSGVASNSAAKVKKDTSKASVASIAGDTTQPRQGSSADASVDDLDDAAESGKKASAKMSKDNTLPTSKGDAKSVKTQAMEETELVNELSKKTLGSYIKKNVRSQADLAYNHGEDPDEYESDPNNQRTGQNRETGFKKAVKRLTKEEHNDDHQDDIDVQSQLKSIFGDDLSEEFTSRATSIFEAAVIARVNDEMDKVSTKLEEQAAEQLIEYKEALVEKVDGYLNYVVEQWMEENKLSIENGLKTEIAEDFISGLKTLFKEHYIEVPEEKYNVMEELQATAESLATELDEAVTANIELAKELNDLKRAQIFEEQTKDLASTEVEKLKRLVEGVELGSEDLYREKVSVIKENYFPKGIKTSPEQVLVESSGVNTTTFDDSSLIAQYAQSISRTIKSR